MKNEKGITLIALVITIIVMLILTAVTVTMAVNGGLFEYAKKAGEATNKAVADEQTWGRGVISGKRIEDWVADSTPPVLSTPWLYGDVNQDGFVDQKDSNKVYGLITGSYNPENIEISRIQADIDGDGSVTSVEGTWISQYVSGTRESIIPANARALNAYNKTSSGFKLRIKAQDKDSGLSKIIWYYKLSTADSYISSEQTIINTKETVILEKELTGLEAGEYIAYVEVFDAKNNVATSNLETVTIP